MWFGKKKAFIDRARDRPIVKPASPSARTARPSTHRTRSEMLAARKAELRGQPAVQRRMPNSIAAPRVRGRWSDTTGSIGTDMVPRREAATARDDRPPDRFAGSRHLMPDSFQGAGVTPSPEAERQAAREQAALERRNAQLQGECPPAMHAFRYSTRPAPL